MTKEEKGRTEGGEERGGAMGTKPVVDGESPCLFVQEKLLS